MKLEIDASNPPKVDVWLGGQEIHDIVRIQIEFYPDAIPTVHLLRLEMKDGKPVRTPDGIKVFQEDFAFDEIIFNGNWSKMVKATVEHEDDDPDIPF